MKQAFYDYFKDKNQLSSKVQFQCIFIITSYFAYHTKNLMDKIKFLELKIKENENNLLKKNSDLKEIIDKLKLQEKIQSQKIKNLEDNNFKNQLDKKSMEKKIKTLETEMQNMETKIKTLENEKNNMKKKIENLEKQVQLLKIDNVKLAATVEANVNQMKECFLTINKFKNYIEELKCENNELRNIIVMKEK